MKYSLMPIRTKADIRDNFRDNPIGRLLEYHNLGIGAKEYDNAELLICMCMDNRKKLSIPDNFAFILRSGGANLSRMDFKASFAIAIGGVRAICLICHDNCRMVNLRSQKTKFIEGMQKVGWNAETASKHFDENVKSFEIGDAIDFVVNESLRLK